MTLRAVLFDLDDTLLEYSANVAPHWAAACRLAAGAGVDVLALVAAVEDRRAWFWSDPVRHALHRTDMLDAWRRIASAALVQVGTPDEPLAHTIAVDFAQRRRAGMRLFDDALRCLAEVRARGLRLGLVTNGDALMQRDKLARFDLARWFDAMVIEGEFGVGKPDPSVYRHVLDRLGVAADDAIMVGDNLVWDVDGAQRVGVRGVWIDRPGRGLAVGTPHRPHRIVRTLDELHPWTRSGG